MPPGVRAPGAAFDSELFFERHLPCCTVALECPGDRSPASAKPNTATGSGRARQRHLASRSWAGGQASMTLEHVADHVLRGGDDLVNWYLVQDPAGVFAIDAGLPRHWPQLLAGLEQLESPRQLAAIVLTHGHVDHVGWAQRAHDQLNAEIFVMEAEAALLASPLRAARHERSPLPYLRHPSARRALKALIAGGALRIQPVSDWTRAPSGDLVRVPGSAKLIPTPGHTTGHCAVLLDAQRVLFTGDALVTVDPLSGGTGPRLMARGATEDSRAARESVQRLAEISADVLLPGHGKPWTATVASAVERALKARHA
jgi:glyoxylase-like metal-dependent hydrolase (beta-lactamase superfamily II)